MKSVEKYIKPQYYKRGYIVTNMDPLCFEKILHRGAYHIVVDSLIVVRYFHMAIKAACHNNILSELEEAKFLTGRNVL